LKSVITFCGASSCVSFVMHASPWLMFSRPLQLPFPAIATLTQVPKAERGVFPLFRPARPSNRGANLS